MDGQAFESKGVSGCSNQTWIQVYNTVGECELSIGEVARVPVLYGFCKDEGLLLTSPFHKEPQRLGRLNRQKLFFYSKYRIGLNFGEEKKQDGKL
jgi:hypothetical protein